MKVSHLIRCNALLVLSIACAGDAPEQHGTTDSTTAPVARTVPDLAVAVALRDTAQATLARLLDQPASARFDSVVVIQPPAEEGRLPAPAVCGRIDGSPGINGRTTPTRFIYQSRWTVFVEEENNRDRFTDLWSRMCSEAGGTVVLEG